MMPVKKFGLPRPVDAVIDRSQRVIGGPGKPVAQRDLTVGGNPHQAESGPARVGLAGPLVNLL